ncbi:MAG: ABC transporter substrate-binding protein [Alphaproteobacteria bacterium]|nr:ABC transporter substrate-binding protein [Alphaproteobacteria bacterium]
MAVAARLLLALALLAGAPQIGAAADLRIALNEDPDLLDPAQGGSFVGREVFAAMCDKLIDLAPDMRFVPQLATEWSWAPDNTALTLKLRDGVVFHDGTGLDAAAVKTNLDRYRTAPESRRKGEVKPIANVAVVDPLTVRIELTQPYAPLLAVLADRAGMMMSPTALAALGDKIATGPVCAGPYRFVERVAQERIVLERFDKYWNPAPYTIERVTYTPVPDTTVRLAGLRSGGFDIIDRLSAHDVAAVKADPALQYVDITALGYNLLSINLNNGAAADNPLGKDKRVREAFELSIDRNILNNVVFEGQFVPSNQFEAPGSRYWDAAHPVPARDVAAAKKLLADAGVPHPAFTLTSGNNTSDLQVAQTLQAMAAEAGFEMKIQATEAATMVQNNSAGNYQAALAIWSGRPDPDGNIAIWIACDGFLNWGKYCDPQLDKNLDDARRTTEAADRAKLYANAADIYLAARPELVLYHFKWLWGISRKVGGFVPNPDGLIRLAGMKIGS